MRRREGEKERRREGEKERKREGEKERRREGTKGEERRGEGGKARKAVCKGGLNKMGHLKGYCIFLFNGKRGGI